MTFFNLPLKYPPAYAIIAQIAFIWGQSSKCDKVTMCYFNALYGANTRPWSWIKPYVNVSLSVVRTSDILKRELENIQNIARI